MHFANRVSDIQCSPFIMISLGSIGIDSVIGELCYKGIILQRNYRKMTSYGHFSIISS